MTRPKIGPVSLCNAYPHLNSSNIHLNFFRTRTLILAYPQWHLLSYFNSYTLSFYLNSLVEICMVQSPYYPFYPPPSLITTNANDHKFAFLSQPIQLTPPGIFFRCCPQRWFYVSLDTALASGFLLPPTSEGRVVLDKWSSRELEVAGILWRNNAVSTMAWSNQLEHVDKWVCWFCFWLDLFCFVTGRHLAFCFLLFSNKSKTTRFDDRQSLERARHELKKKMEHVDKWAKESFDKTFSNPEVCICNTPPYDDACFGFRRRGSPA